MSLDRWGELFRWFVGEGDDKNVEDGAGFMCDAISEHVVDAWQDYLDKPTSENGNDFARALRLSFANDRNKALIKDMDEEREDPEIVNDITLQIAAAHLKLIPGF